MGEQAMFNRIVLGGIRRVMSNANFNAKIIAEGLQSLLKQVSAGTVTAPAIAQQQNRGGQRIQHTTVDKPPMAN
jgi:hypothetical protein